MALRAYAMQADDPELETMARRIRARAERRMGEISRGLPSARGQNLENVGRSTGGTTEPKTTVLAAAGIDRQRAHRAEKLAAIPLAEFDARAVARLGWARRGEARVIEGVASVAALSDSRRPTA